jgi:hypothetical protein
MKERLRLMLDARIVAEVRAMAAERDVVESVRRRAPIRVIRNRRSFRSARRRALECLRVGLDLRWTPSRSRDVGMARHG